MTRACSLCRAIRAIILRLRLSNPNFVRGKPSPASSWRFRRLRFPAPLHSPRVPRELGVSQGQRLPSGATSRSSSPPLLSCCVPGGLESGGSCRDRGPAPQSRPAEGQPAGGAARRYCPLTPLLPAARQEILEASQGRDRCPALLRRPRGWPAGETRRYVALRSPSPLPCAPRNLRSEPRPRPRPGASAPPSRRPAGAAGGAARAQLLPAPSPSLPCAPRRIRSGPRPRLRPGARVPVHASGITRRPRGGPAGAAGGTARERPLLHNFSWRAGPREASLLAGGQCDDFGPRVDPWIQVTRPWSTHRATVRPVTQGAPLFSRKMSYSVSSTRRSLSAEASAGAVRCATPRR
jgi:hypothetical protein